MEEKPTPTPPPHFKIGQFDSESWKMQRPVSVDGCLIMFCEHGTLEISTNSGRNVMHPGNMAFIVFDMVAVPITLSDDFSARFISLDFDIAQDIFFHITSNRFWDYIYTSPVFAVSHGIIATLTHWFSVIEWIYANFTGSQFEKIMRNEIENFILIIATHIEASYGTLGTNPSKNRAWIIANEFIGLISRYYSHHHDVAFYAAKLSITPNYLNIITKRVLGVSAKEQINIKLEMVVRMLLDTTDLTVKEIAERLHYDDPSYLCRIFRKHNGLSPIHYRNSHKHNGQ